MTMAANPEARRQAADDLGEAGAGMRPGEAAIPPAAEAVADGAPAAGDSSHASPLRLPLVILALLATAFALQWSRNFVVPVLLGILITYTLYPMMDGMTRLRIPRLVSATILTGGLVTMLVGTAVALREEAAAIVEQVPVATQRLARELGRLGSQSPTAIRRMQEAANELERATNQAVGGGAARPKASPPQPMFKLGEWLLAGSVGAMAVVGQFVMVLFLVFFLLMSGDMFKRKLVRIVGASLWRKKIALHILEDINISIQRYMFMLVVTNVLLGVMMWVALSMIGLENAGAWALFGAITHIIPYFGPLFITAATGLVAYLQFGSLSMMLLTMAASAAIATFVGMFVTTWMAGRIARMNAAAVFIALLFWGWLWGIWGLLLGIPIIVIVKVIAERIEGLAPVAELLGE